MFKKLRDWLRLRYLPRWAAESLVEENKRLKTELVAERQRGAALESYIDGMKIAIRLGRPECMKRGESVGTDQGTI